MIFEALALYVDSVAAFWVSLANHGFFKVIVIFCIIYWFVCRPRRWRRHRWAWGCGCRRGCGCSCCDCVCGGCACGAEGHADRHGDHSDEKAAPSTD